MDNIFESMKDQFERETGIVMTDNSLQPQSSYDPNKRGVRHILPVYLEWLKVQQNERIIEKLNQIQAALSNSSASKG